MAAKRAGVAGQNPSKK
ncbi:Protein of unknown function [Anaplasma phagocytophilum]|uniref:Uncharacterized protein n=1 Tax=Anaplasma phagocytophilum TaxID=948 RepID=A0A098GJ94_ANAPH|nr:Protein of unknown function [Anaplasma phagocytophilum]